MLFPAVTYLRKNAPSMVMFDLSRPDKTLWLIGLKPIMSLSCLWETGQLCHVSHQAGQGVPSGAVGGGPSAEGKD